MRQTGVVDVVAVAAVVDVAVAVAVHDPVGAHVRAAAALVRVAALGQVPAPRRQREDQHRDPPRGRAVLTRDPEALALARFRTGEAAWADPTADSGVAERTAPLSCRRGQVDPSLAAGPEGLVALAGREASAVLVASADPENPAGLAVLAASADPENPAGLAVSVVPALVRAALAGRGASESPVAPEALAVPAASGNPAAPVALVDQVGLEDPEVLAGLSLGPA